MKNLSKAEQISLGKKLLNTPDKYKESIKVIDLLEKDSKIDAVYIYESIRGGESIIVDFKGEVLWASSAGFQKHLEEYNKGRRTSIESLKNRKR